MEQQQVVNVGIPKPPMIEDENGNPKLDLRVHIRDPKSGAISKVQPYKLFVIHGIHYFEYPIGSKNMWFENGEAAGRLQGNGKVDTGAKHEEYNRPLTASEVEAKRYDTLAQQNEKLKRELDAIKREQKFAKMEAAAEKKATKGTVKTSLSAATAATGAKETEAKNGK